MARAGDVIGNPATGERIVFRRTALETNGEVLEYEIFFRPRGFVVREHLHPQQEERHEVLSGTLGVSVEGRDQRLGAGDVLTVPPGTPHRLWSVGEDEVHAVFELRPALRSATLIETFVGLARDGKVSKRGFPNIFQLAVLAREYESEGYATRPPLLVQRVLFGGLAPIGRLLRYRAQYPQYSSSS